MINLNVLPEIMWGPCLPNFGKLFWGLFVIEIFYALCAFIVKLELHCYTHQVKSG